jgi:hypothetical protein
MKKDVFFDFLAKIWSKATSRTLSGLRGPSITPSSRFFLQKGLQLLPRD